MSAARAAILSTITEKEFAQTVVTYAVLRGWLVYRTWNSRHSPAGFPDLCMARLSRLVFAELKRMDAKPPTKAQLDWLATLEGTGKCEVYLWKPSDWDEIEEVLR